MRRQSEIDGGPGVERPRRPHVVIVGAGFAGLEAARELADAPVRVTVIDRRNHHLFQPLLYQVATAGLAGPDVAATIRSVLRKQENTTVWLGEVVDIDPARRCVILADAEVEYDMLILAAGADISYFGHDEWETHAPGLKSIENALEIRRRILTAFEAAERESNPDRRRHWLTFVVVGGGPTGVELAGALAEIARHTMARDFRNYDPSDAKIILLEAEVVLPGMPRSLADEACRQLRRRGVDVRTKTMVTGVDADGVDTKEGRVRARTVLWSAGVRASPLAESLEAETERGRVCVEKDLSVPGHPEVFVVGDLLGLKQDGEMLPGLAQVALQSGRHAARNVWRRATGESTEPFVYRHKGSIATIGRSSAVADMPRRQLHGFTAWIVAWLVHIFWLIGFRNRLGVLIGWMWAYISWKRTARVIVPERLDPALLTATSRRPHVPQLDATAHREPSRERSYGT